MTPHYSGRRLRGTPCGRSSSRGWTFALRLLRLQAPECWVRGAGCPGLVRCRLVGSSRMSLTVVDRYPMKPICARKRPTGISVMRKRPLLSVTPPVITLSWSKAKMLMVANSMGAPESASSTVPKTTPIFGRSPSGRLPPPGLWAQRVVEIQRRSRVRRCAISTERFKCCEVQCKTRFRSHVAIRAEGVGTRIQSHRLDREGGIRAVEARPSC